VGGGNQISVTAVLHSAWTLWSAGQMASCGVHFFSYLGNLNKRLCSLRQVTQLPSSRAPGLQCSARALPGEGERSVLRCGSHSQQSASQTQT